MKQSKTYLTKNHKGHYVRHNESNNKTKLFLIFLFAVIGILGVTSYVKSDEVTYSKIKPIEGNCVIKVEIKQVGNDVVKQEILECADGRKSYDGPNYWELFAQFYYKDVYTPAYCRVYDRPGHFFKKPGTICLTNEGQWRVVK